MMLEGCFLSSNSISVLLQFYSVALFGSTDLGPGIRHAEAVTDRSCEHSARSGCQR